MTYAHYVYVGGVVLIALAAIDIAAQLRALRKVLELQFRANADHPQPYAGAGPVPMPRPVSGGIDAAGYPEPEPFVDSGPLHQDSARPAMGSVHPARMRAMPRARRAAPAIPAGFAETGFAVWSYRGGRWIAELDQSRPGFQVGPPPASPGDFEGHCVRTGCVPRSA